MTAYSALLFDYSGSVHFSPVPPERFQINRDQTGNSGTSQII